MDPVQVSVWMYTMCVQQAYILIIIVDENII